MEQFSAAARVKQEAVNAKLARGEGLDWSDLFGIAEPHPDLPDCQSWSGDVQCQLPNHHEGLHRAEVSW